MTSWSERVLTDPTLAAWRDAEVARAGIDVQALRVENAHRDAVIQALQQQVKELEQDREKKRRRSA